MDCAIIWAKWSCLRCSIIVITKVMFTFKISYSDVKFYENSDSVHCLIKKMLYSIVKFNFIIIHTNSSKNVFLSIILNANISFVIIIIEHLKPLHFAFYFIIQSLHRGFNAFRSVPFRSALHSVSFRSVPFRSVTYRSVPENIVEQGWNDMLGDGTICSGTERLGFGTGNE
jgi:hypothetical protein